MAMDLVTFNPEMDIHLAMKLLLTHQISGAPVVDPYGHVVGMLSEKDCFAVAFSASYHQDRGGRVAEYMSRTVQTIEASADIVEVAELFLRSRYRRFPVVEKNRLVGQINRRDLLLALEELW
jgi:CBS domain-containing protein